MLYIRWVHEPHRYIMPPTIGLWHAFTACVWWLRAVVVVAAASITVVVVVVVVAMIFLLLLLGPKAQDLHYHHGPSPKSSCHPLMSNSSYSDQ